MGFGDLSCFNEGRSRTPCLDKLVGESVWFNQAYSASAVCAPARAALLTGRYGFRTGVGFVASLFDPLELHDGRYEAIESRAREIHVGFKDSQS